MSQGKQSSSTFNLASFRCGLLLGRTGERGGFLQCLFGISSIDLTGRYRTCREDRDDRTLHLDEATVDEEGFLAGGGRRLEFSVAQAADEWCSTGENSDLAVEQRKPQRRRRLIEHRSLGSHDHQLQLFVSHVSSRRVGRPSGAPPDLTVAIRIRSRWHSQPHRVL